MVYILGINAFHADSSACVVVDVSITALYLSIPLCSWTLCKIGLNADGDIWDNDDINAAIASIKWGLNWVDTAQATAYKTCNYGGYLDWRSFLFL